MNLRLVFYNCRDGRETMKRGRSESKVSEAIRNRSSSQDRVSRKRKLPAMEASSNIPEMTETCRPVGVFEFPWQSEAGSLAPELEGFSLRDVFFSSLVDGCSASIGFPGDRISPPRSSPIVLPVDKDESCPSDDDSDGVDCIWSCALSQPLSVVHYKTFGV
ncbi:hypothetical protein HPP92_018913 [Vanilla planifolia]|uniref:Uncharacterized protein n=1 Tax=Vanilla planifolia TaxID=51239 RepID=A0A835UMU8_VANPL|nr:hypothetical protein HPP92_018913 [Vanilla planifolia]